VWHNIVTQVPCETKEQLEDIFKLYSLTEHRNSKSLGRWLDETSVWEHWFVPLLPQMSKLSSLRLEEVYLFPACFVLLYKLRSKKESFQIYRLEDSCTPNTFHVVKELTERIALHLQTVEMCVSWKLDLFIQLLQNLICYQNFEFISFAVAPLLQTFPLSDLRIFLSKKMNRQDWNTFLETYQIPIARSPKASQYSFIKLAISHLYDLMESISASSSKNILEIQDQLQKLSDYLLWLYFAFQNSSMGLYLAIFVVCYSDSKSSDSIVFWKRCLENLKEFLWEEHSLCIVGRCWQLTFVVLLRIWELMRKRREERTPCRLEVSLRHLICGHLDSWKKLTGIHCCFPDISYFHALLGNNPCIIPPSYCFPSMLSYLCSMLTICKAELAYKLYSALNSHKENMETERSFLFSVTHLEQSKHLRQTEHFQFSYTGQVNFLGSDTNWSRMIHSFGKIGALFICNGASDSLNLDDIQWIGICYSAKWNHDKEESQSCAQKFFVSFLSNDEVIWEQNGKRMYLICVEAANDIHPQILQELYECFILSIANLDKEQHQEVIPEFFSKVLTQEYALVDERKKALELILTEDIRTQSICLYPFITNAQELMSILSHIVPSFQLEANENFRRSVYLRKLKETFINTSCSFVASDRSNTCHESSSVSLYEAQKAALCASWLQRLTLIRGPPGTGKTQVASCIVRFLLQNRFAEMKIENGHVSSSVLMIIAQSNEAADHLAKKIIQHCYPEESRYPGIDLLSCRSVAMLHPLLQPVLRLGRQSTDADTRKFTLEGHYHKIKEFRAKLWKHLLEFAKQYKDNNNSSSWLSSLCEAIEEYERQPGLLSKHLDQVGVSWLETMTQKYSNKQELEKSPHWKRIALLRDCILLRKCDALLQSFGPRLSDYFKELLSHCQLVITTFASLVKYAEFWPFDGTITKVAAAIVEEAALVTEWNQFILFSKYQPLRTILIGDDLQLAPIVQYRSANNDILDHLSSSNQLSLFARLIQRRFPFIQLQEQGRAAPCIADLYRFRYQNKSSYQTGELLTSTQNTLHDIHPDHHFWMPDGICSRVLFLQVPSLPSESAFHENLMEAKAIAAFLHYLYYWNVAWDRIAVLTPYRRQKKLLKQTLQNYFTERCIENTTVHDPSAFVFTTDEFQGKEKDIVLVSLVVKSSSVITSHLRDQRRINVLTSRARCGLYLFGNYDALYKCSEWKRVLDAISSVSLSSSSSHASSLESPQYTWSPLCKKTPDSSYPCVWNSKDVLLLLEKWLEERGDNPTKSIEQLLSQWKI